MISKLTCIIELNRSKLARSTNSEFAAQLSLNKPTTIVLKKKTITVTIYCQAFKIYYNGESVTKGASIRSKVPTLIFLF